jgi:hypothetical protein
VLGSINGVNNASASTNVGIGTTSPAYTLDVHGTSNFTGAVNLGSSVGIGTTSPATTLQVVGYIRVGTSNTDLGCVQGFGDTAIAGTCSSDLRLKTNILPFAPVLDRIAKLQPVHFDWKAKEYPEYHFGPALSSGLIAQEVEKVFPEMVSVDGRGYKMVNYSELPYLLLGAVRELKAENDAMRTENDAKEEEIRRLTVRVEQMRKLQQQLASLEARLERVEKRPNAELKKSNAASKAKKRNVPAPSANRPEIIAQARPSK